MDKTDLYVKQGRNDFFEQVEVVRIPDGRTYVFVFENDCIASAYRAKKGQLKLLKRIPSVALWGLVPPLPIEQPTAGEPPATIQ